jgi:uncharacterized protein involved in exopolysaccharide biosynthesis
MLGKNLEAMNSRDLWGTLRRGKRTILIWTGLFAALAVGLDLMLPPVYRASVRLEIRKPPDRSPLTGQSFTNSGYQSENVSMYTAAERIRDRRLLGAIANEFAPAGWIQTLPNATSPPENVTGPLQWARSANARTLVPGSGGADRTMLDAQVDWLHTIVTVEPVQDTRLVDLRVEHGNPQAARTIADRLAQLFVEDQYRQAASADTMGLIYLGNQLAQMNARFQDARNSSDASQGVGAAVLEARIRALSDAAVALNSEYLKVQNERFELRARLKRLAMSNPETADSQSVALADDAVLNGLQRDIESCRVQLASARNIYKSKHPRLMSLESQYAALQSAYVAEQQRALSRLRAEDEILAAREREAQAARSRNEQALGATEKQSERAAGAQAELKGEQDLYGLLVAKIQQGRVEGLLTSRPVEIVDAATVAPHPVRPRKTLNLAVCLTTGLLLGSGHVLLRSSNRRTVLAPEDVEPMLGLRLLGVIPKRD